MSMAAITKCCTPLLKRMAKSSSSKFRVDRLCSRRLAHMSLGAPSYVESKRPTSRSGSLITFLNVRKPNMTDPASEEYKFFVNGSSRPDIKPLHAVLEQCPDFQGTVFSQETFKMFIHFENIKRVVILSKGDLNASLTDLIDYVLFQTNLVSGQDFIATCNIIKDRVPLCSLSELLDIVRAVCFVSERDGNKNLGGAFNNIDILWGIIATELLSRFNFSNPQTLNSYLKILDLLFWTKHLDSSAFSYKLLTSLVGKHLVYPSGVQLLYHLSYLVTSTKLPKVDFKFDPLFIERIKCECPIDVFLLAVESYTATLLSGSHTYYATSAVLPYPFYYFLFEEAKVNVNDDNTLTAITRLLHTVKKPDSIIPQFQELLDAISVRDACVPPLVFFYILQAMAINGIQFDSYYKAMENFLVTDRIHQRLLHVILKALYGSDGPNSVSRYADTADHVFRNNFSLRLELLERFCIYTSSGIDAFYLWEEAINSKRAFPRTKNADQLMVIADDCIEVHAPEYKGSRLDDQMRTDICLHSTSVPRKGGPRNEYSGFAQVFRKLTHKQCHVTCILPGLTYPGVQDVIVCTDKAGTIMPSGIRFESMEPWKVKKIQPSQWTSTKCFYAFWARNYEWERFRVILKQRLLEKLGYISIMVNHETWGTHCTRRNIRFLKQFPNSKSLDD